jgi:hypothetical protein
MLERGDEGQLDALAQLVARVWPGQPVLEAGGLVGVRLHPDRLDHRLAGTVVRVRGRAVVDGQHALGPPRDVVEGRVRRDRVQPGAQRAAALEAAQPAPRPQERLLQRVLRVVDGAEHPVAVGVQLAAVGLDQTREGVLLAASGMIEVDPLLLWGGGRRHAPHPNDEFSAPAGSMGQACLRGRSSTSSCTPAT